MVVKPHQGHPLWFAFMLHRTSGVALALFLPAHFYVLALALNQPERLDGFFNWADTLLVQVAEFGLVFLLAVHIFGGLRLLALEFLAWTDNQKSLAAAVVAISFLVSTSFLLRAI